MYPILLHTHRYTSSGAESALQRCVERLGELQRQSGERGQEKRELEERTKALQKQLANAKVSKACEPLECSQVLKHFTRGLRTRLYWDTI